MGQRRRPTWTSRGAVLAGALVLGMSAPLPVAAEPTDTDSDRLLPNLRVLPAADVHVTRGPNGRKLRFESGLANVGDGPVEVRPNRNRPCPDGRHHSSQILYRDGNGNGRYDLSRDTDVARRSAGCMVFHAMHDHWHLEAASLYTLYKASRPEVSRIVQRKMSFCLRDSRRVPPRWGTYPYAERYGACSRYSPQGISVGWVDVYQSYLAGQAIRLPRRMGDDLYCLRITVDPRNQLVETVETDNTSVRAFVMRGDRIRYRDSARCR